MVSLCDNVKNINKLIKKWHGIKKKLFRYRRDTAIIKILFDKMPRYPFARNTAPTLITLNSTIIMTINGWHIFSWRLW